MVRRDEFINKINEFNNKEYINDAVSELESFVDTELQKEENIIKLINMSSLGNTSTSGSIVDVGSVVDTASIHRDITVNGANGFKNGFPIFNDNLKYKNGDDATLTPWFDLTISQNIDSSIRITLPENTNKMAAVALRNKFLSTSEAEVDEDGQPVNGFWSRVLSVNSGVIDILQDQDTIKVEYNINTNRIDMIFKLV